MNLQIKKRIIQWLYNQLNPKVEYTKEQKEHINRFKSYFRIYFEGGYDYHDPIVDIPISRFDITDLQFNFKKELLIITIVLGRPGILIGKGGNVIDGLNAWLLPHNMKVEIKESKLWSFL